MTVVHEQVHQRTGEQQQVGQSAEQVEEFPHGFTASGHPVGCAVALKAIDVVMNESYNFV